MSDPFRIEGPAAISFSGGRTSGYMLRRILDAHGGKLPADVHVLFANTGKEREETLEFVRECGERWGVEIHWLEYARCYEPSAMTGAYRRRPVCVEVDFGRASRRGEPFAEVIRARSYVPNPITRFCTAELKIRTMHRWLRARGYDEWTQADGLRRDEADRVSRLLGRSETPAEDKVCPLYDAGITLADVTRFWASQPFDLGLKPHEGNCDLCFLKGNDRRVAVMRSRPDLAAWWIEQEESVGRFRAHGFDYRELLDMATDRRQLDLFEDNTLRDCACTD